MREDFVPAFNHGSIVIGILPLATALFGTLRFGERPSPGFWGVAVAGSSLVTAFALWQGGEFHPADFALFAAVVAAVIAVVAVGRRMTIKR